MYQKKEVMGKRKGSKRNKKGDDVGNKKNRCRNI